MAYFLGIDCGGTAIKSAVYDESMRELGSARETLEIINPKPGYAQRDMQRLKEQCFNTIRGAIAKSGVDSADIKGIGISAQGKGLFGIDKQGNAAPCGGILSADKRSLDIVKIFEKDKVREKIYPKTRQALWTGHPATILRYLKEHDLKSYESISDILMSHDYLRFCLTGTRNCEVTNISESNLYNIMQSRYDRDLCTELGIEEAYDKLPDIVESTQICGQVTKEAAAITGLSEGTAVVGGLFDVVSVAICAGLKDESALNISMGTWAVATGFTHKITDDEDLFVYGRHCSKDSFIVHEASPTSSGNLEWICNALNISDFNVINSMVEQVAHEKHDVFFMPFLYGSNVSLDNTAGFYGLQSYHTNAHLFSAAFEGVVFSHIKHIKSIMRKFKDVQKLIVTGGPTHSPVWMQMLSDAAGKEIYIPRLKETGCLGAAITAMVGLGVYKSVHEAIMALNVTNDIVTPDSSRFDYYAQKYEKYTLLTQALSDYHVKVNALQQ